MKDGGILMAGRTAMLTLWPFSLSELRRYKSDWTPFELIVRGCFPRLYEEGLEPRRFFNSYLQTYVERDVRALIQLRDLAQFQKFLALLAGRVGQVINLASLGNDVGLAAFLLGIHTEEQASRDPLRGNLYDSLVIAEIVKGALNKGIRPEIYFFRDSRGNEVDFLIREKGELTPVEIKSAGTFSMDFVKGLNRFQALGLSRRSSAVPWLESAWQPEF